MDPTGTKESCSHMTARNVDSGQVSRNPLYTNTWIQQTLICFFFYVHARMFVDLVGRDCGPP